MTRACMSPVVDQAKLPEIAKSMISSSHQCNWLSVEGEERIIIYNHGSVPGDPWADIIFGLLYSKVTTEIRRAVIQMGGE
eukprot:13401723-Alexandrium_andersonii.AAC.1